MDAADVTDVDNIMGDVTTEYCNQRMSLVVFLRYGVLCSCKSQFRQPFQQANVLIRVRGLCSPLFAV